MNNKEYPKIDVYVVDDNVRIKIETERLFINSYSDKDFENCVLLYGDEKLSKYFDYGKSRSQEEVAELVVQRSLNFLNQRIPLGLFSVFDKVEGKFLGQADLLPTDELYEVELGCILRREYHNQGYPVEICKALMVEYIDYINKFHPQLLKAPIHRVIATAHPKNYASQKLIKNLGMTLEKSKERFGQTRLWYSYLKKYENKN